MHGQRPVVDYERPVDYELPVVDYERHVVDYERLIVDCFFLIVDEAICGRRLVALPFVARYWQPQYLQQSKYA